MSCGKNVLCGQEGVIIKTLETKHNSYSFFHYCLHVSSDNVQTAAEHLLSPEAWPTGTLIRHFYNNTRNHEAIDNK